MAVRDVIKVPNPLLHQKSEEIQIIDKNIKKLARDMYDTMKAKNGIGLAGVQIGILKRIVVIEIEELDVKLTLMNPKVVSFANTQTEMEEGCLSVPNQTCKVLRPDKVVVEYTDLKSKKQHIEADGLLAKCLQHEIDHLNGITILDK